MKNWQEAVKLHSYEDSPIRLLLYGEPGAGKTHFALTAPKPFVIDTDRGLATGKKMGITPHVLTLTKTDKVYMIVRDVLLALRDSKPPFDEIKPETVVLDSLSSLSDLLLDDIMNHPPLWYKAGKKELTEDKADFDHWGLLQNRLKELLIITRDLPIHVIATAGVRLEKDEYLGNFIARPSIPGSTREVIGHYFDEFFYIEPKRKGDGTKYILYTQKRLYYGAKSRGSRPAEMENATFKDLL